MNDADTSTAKTVEKAVHVIESFVSARRNLGISEISRRTGINKSTVQRIVNTLCRHDYLQRNLQESSYQLGFKFVHISDVILGQIDLRPIAKPYLEGLRNKTGETVHLMVLDRDMGIYLDAVESRQTTRVVSAVGSRDELHTSAVGKALLAFMPEAGVDEIFRTQTLKAKTPRSLTDLASLKEHLRAVRRRGYSTDDEEGERGTRCVGAPILDHTGRVIASISVAAPAIRLGHRDVPRFAKLVMETAQNISRSLGKASS